MRIKRTVASSRWTPLAVSLAMSALLCATIAYWALQWLAPAVPIAPAGSLSDRQDTPDLVAAVPLFGLPVGGRAAGPDAALSNIRVLGVAASTVRGSAVLSVDGKPPRAYMVGDAVTAEATLAEVRSDAAVIERSGMRFELAAPQRPSVAILSAGPARSEATASAPAASAPAASVPVTAPAQTPAQPAVSVTAPAQPAAAAAAPPPAPPEAQAGQPPAAAGDDAQAATRP